MFAGIFAAGEGSRFSRSYPGVIKPMVPVAGRPLIEWTVRLLAEAGASDITVLLNSRGAAVPRHLEKAFSGSIRFNFLIQDTASSWESFRLVSRALALKTETFLLSAVDSFYCPQELRKFYSFYSAKRPDAVLGVTDSIADEKPLWADLEEDGRIIRMGADSVQKKYATSGVYLVGRTLASAMPEAERHGALREYLTDVVRRGGRVWSRMMQKSVDVDDASDLALAEQFVASHLGQDTSRISGTPPRRPGVRKSFLPQFNRRGES